MKYLTPEVEIEKFSAVDVIAASGEQEPTNPEETTKYDPYESDKW